MISPAHGVAVYALTSAGADLAQHLAGQLPGADLFLPQRLAAGREPAKAFTRLAAALAENFTAYEGHILFCAAGIVVRALAPLLQGKAQDPAVVVVDQNGRHAVSLLSGHLGGANRLAQQVADILGGQAVITTATDSAGLPSLEVVARDRGCQVENLAALAGLSSALLEGCRVELWDPLNWLTPALAAWPERFIKLKQRPSPQTAGPPLAWVDWRAEPTPAHWLVIRPPCLWVGLGCNRGTPADEMEALFSKVFQDRGLSPACLRGLASIDRKQDEAGLLELAGRLKVECRFFSADQLREVKAPNPSPRVARHMGVDSVCEAAAMLAATSPELLVTKQKTPNVTLAVALAGSG